MWWPNQGDLLSFFSPNAMFSKRVVSESDAVMEAGWKRRSRATAPPGALQRVAPSDEAPQARGTVGMCAIIVFALRRGAAYCVHYIVVPLRGLKIICQKVLCDAINMPIIIDTRQR